MQIIAVYLPNPDELQFEIAIVIVAFATLCYFANRMKLSVAVAALLMLLGCGVAIGPDILSASKEDLGYYGDWARKTHKCNHSDGLIAITAYMEVGYGKLLAFAGMSTALVCYASIVTFRRYILRERRKSPTVENAIAPE